MDGEGVGFQSEGDPSEMRIAHGRSGKDADSSSRSISNAIPPEKFATVRLADNTCSFSHSGHDFLASTAQAQEGQTLTFMFCISGTIKSNQSIAPLLGRKSNAPYLSTGTG